MSRPDAIVVGAGFAGSILAERLATERGYRVLVLERRAHIAGNMYDDVDDAGIRVARYGPHIFRSDDDTAMAYLARFATLRHYVHRVLAAVDGQLVPVPPNLTTLEALLGADAPAAIATLLATFGAEREVPIASLRHHAEPLLRSVGEQVFEKIFLHYSVKQWGKTPDALDFDTISRRVPLRLSRNDSYYFNKKHQGVPGTGYTEMFAKLLAHPNIEVRLGVDAKSLLRADAQRGLLYFDGQAFGGPCIYSGAVDELFDDCFGALPYRALEFVYRTLPKDTHQPVAVVNYPNEHAYTRITEYKYLYAQTLPGVTTIAEEYPLAYDRLATRGNEPYYPIPAADSAALHARYVALAAQIPNLHLLGRLAEYRYYDMNDIVVRALAAFAALPR